MPEEVLTIKEKKPGQRACDEKDAKGEICLGHLKLWPAKRWSKALRSQLESGAVIYRCERCHTLYRPVEQDRSSAGLKFDQRPVNILGDAARLPE